MHYFIVKTTSSFCFSASVFLFLLAAQFSYSYGSQALINKLYGDVQVLKSGASGWAGAKLSQVVDSGDRVKTGSGSFVEIVTIKGYSIKLNQNSEMEVSVLEDAATKAKLQKGSLKAKAGKLGGGEMFEVETPNATCAVRGTEFDVKHINNITQVAVYQGVVAAMELITRQSVMVGAGKYSSVTAGIAPVEPKDFNIRREGKTLNAEERRLAEAKKEIFEEISKQEVLGRASEEIKNAEYQNGKTMIDVYGKRLRLEEYILRPQADQFKYVVLNERGDRFDFGKMLFTFNKDLPEDLSTATKDMFHKEQEPPSWFPTDVLSIISNTTDKVTENASGGHPQVTSLGNSVYYDTVFDKYDFYANDLRLWGYDRTISPNTEYYHGGAEPESSWSQPGGFSKFHFIAKDTYSDGTWIQAEDFIINDDGKIAEFGDIVDPANISAEDIKSKILMHNFERVYTSSLFGERTIDLVYSSKLLSDSGMLNLPAALEAPKPQSLDLPAYGEPSAGYIKLARLKESIAPDELPTPLKPFEEEETALHDEAAEKGPGVNHFFTMDILGGRYFSEGSKTPFKGNAEVVYVPVINFSKDTALLPIYSGSYNSTLDVQELQGGGTLTQKQMEHSLFIKGVRKTANDYSLKADIGYTGEWIAETSDETLSNGLFNNNRYSLGFSGDKPVENIKYKAGCDFSITDYTNYKALSSDPRFVEAGITETMGTDVLDFLTSSVNFGGTYALKNNIILDSLYSFSMLNFPDQKVIQRSGDYSNTKRMDFSHTLSFSASVDSGAGRIGLGYGIRHYSSNQNAYDANRTYFTLDYYDYIEHRLTPSVSFFLNKQKTSNLSMWWDVAFLKYDSRKAQSAEGSYGTNNIGQVTNSFGVWCKYPLYDKLSLKLKANYLMSSSNMKYESVYRYNYDAVNYFVGFGWEM